MCCYAQMVQLKMSYDPSIKIFCPECDNTTPTMTRRIISSEIPKAVGKVFAGDWFKETYGTELGEACIDEATQQESRKSLEAGLRKQLKEDE